jgi:hypothetical protein
VFAPSTATAVDLRRSNEQITYHAPALPIVLTFISAQTRQNALNPIPRVVFPEHRIGLHGRARVWHFKRVDV